MTGGDAETGLPLVRTWPAVYALVTGLFVAYVAGLTLLSRVGW